MMEKYQAISWFFRLTALISVACFIAACERPDPDVGTTAELEQPSVIEGEASPQAASQGLALQLPPTPVVHRTETPLPVYFGTPTPDPTRSESGSSDPGYDVHLVAIGETLSQIAQTYGSSVEELISINQMADGDLLDVGQQLLVPAGQISYTSDFKVLPDSELVFGPSAQGFSPRDVVESYGSYLINYFEDVEGRSLAGPEILQLVADRQRVNPRLLLALLEYQSGWVTHAVATPSDYPLGYPRPGYEGLYQQLSWAANRLNLGYYGRSEGGLIVLEFADGSRLNFSPGINAGTAGVQMLFAGYPDLSREAWPTAIGPEGLYATYNRLFGNPFAYTVDPLWPENLAQPAFRMPWPVGETWYFTGGPHGGWASGSGWAAIDFAPPEDQFGCYQSESWVTAMTDGMVTSSDFGAVVVDLDGDGYAGTGWSIIYLHLETRDRVPAGSFVQAGDRLGHPSCEGGYTNGTHVHIGRTYNGRWVAADGTIPFVIAGWTSQGLGREYDGLLIRGDAVKEACECREEGNALLNE